MNPMWAEEFNIPWEKFPKRDLLSVIEKGMRPKPSARREMVRILVTEISKVTKKPGKKALTTIAQKVVKKHPKSFLDTIAGTVVGCGYDSLLKQLQCRCDNMNRKATDSLLKRKKQEESDSVTICSTKKKVCLNDQYGCINFMPSAYPEGESETSLENMKLLLQEKYKERLNDGVEPLLENTYISQRTDIIVKNMSTSDLLMNWPYLFEQVGMLLHFKNLTGISIREKIQSAFTHKGETILKWMKDDPSKNLRKIQEELVEAKCYINNGTPETVAVTCAVMSYFCEKEETVYKCVEVGFFLYSTVYRYYPVYVCVLYNCFI